MQSHYLDPCWLTFSLSLRDKLRWHLSQNAKILINLKMPSAEWWPFHLCPVSMGKCKKDTIANALELHLSCTSLLICDRLIGLEPYTFFVVCVLSQPKCLMNCKHKKPLDINRQMVFHKDIMWVLVFFSLTVLHDNHEFNLCDSNQNGPFRCVPIWTRWCQHKHHWTPPHDLLYISFNLTFSLHE